MALAKNSAVQMSPDPGAKLKRKHMSIMVQFSTFLRSTGVAKENKNNHRSKGDVQIKEALRISSLSSFTSKKSCIRKTEVVQSTYQQQENRPTDKNAFK